jgi:hypothetical protein
LLLSRTLYLPETLEPQAQIAATISALPESAASATSAQIGEREGKIRNVVRLEQIREEQRKIEEEAAETLKAKKAAEKKLKLPPIKDVQELLHHAAIEKELLGQAPVMVRDSFCLIFPNLLPLPWPDSISRPMLLSTYVRIQLDL